MQLEVDGIALDAISVGGLETCLGLPRQRLCFDIGRCPDAAVGWPWVLFTHAHMDHMGGVAWHAATRALRKLAPPTYVVGPENADAMRDLFAVWRRLDRSDLPHELRVVAPGEELVLPNKWIARPFRSPHRAPCQGYALWERRTKLKPEYAGLPEEELRRLRIAGEAISAPSEICRLVFTGDTLIEVVEREEAVRRARVLVMEVTFVDQRVSVEECRAKGHVHLDEVAERAALFQNEALVLTHFSSRYGPADILRALDEKLPPELRRRVVPLLPEGRGVDSRADSRTPWSG